jgi:hypothetical protein
VPNLTALNQTLASEDRARHRQQIRQHICCRVDFTLGAIDNCHVDVFKVFGRRVVNDRRGIGAAWREWAEEEERGQGSAEHVQRGRSRP